MGFSEIISLTVIYTRHGPVKNCKDLVMGFLSNWQPDRPLIPSQELGPHAESGERFQSKFKAKDYQTEVAAFYW